MSGSTSFFIVLVIFIKNESNKHSGNKNFLRSNKNIPLKITLADWNNWTIEFQGLSAK
jgi:hypothetical protein